MPNRARVPRDQVLAEALDEAGRYDAFKLAEYIDWSKQEMAAFLRKHPSSLSRESASLAVQEPLAALAAVVKELLFLVDEDQSIARAWLRTPIRVLDEKSPKEVILAGNLDTVASLLGEIQSGFVA